MTNDTRQPHPDVEGQPGDDGARPAAKPGQRRKSVKVPREKVAKKKSRFLTSLNGFLSLLMFIMLGTAGAGVWYGNAVDAPGPLGETKAFAVRKEEATSSVAQRLAAEGIIPSARLFMLQYQLRGMAARASGKPLLIKAGDYEIQPQASLREVLDVLGEGRTVLSRITVPEGLTTWQIVERIKKDRNLTGEIAELPPEGALLPDTYKFTRGMTQQAFIDMLIAKRNEFLEQAWAARAEGLPIKTLEEALVLASIVERETGKNDERERVAAVFVNRLRKSMRLQSDPTILYGLFGGQVSWGRPIYKSEIRQPTTHNTYTIDGLPPTPICNPGRAAIQAVLNPAKTNDLYFVADGKGGHVFTSTLRDHEAAVANWRKFEKEARVREAARAQARAAAAASQPQAGAQTTATAASALPIPSAGPGPGVREADAEDDPAAGAAAPVQAAAPAAASVAVKSVSTVPAPVSAAALAPPPTTVAAPVEGTGAIALPTRKPKRQ